MTGALRRSVSGRRKWPQRGGSSSRVHPEEGEERRLVSLLGFFGVESAPPAASFQDVACAIRDGVEVELEPVQREHPAEPVLDLFRGGFLLERTDHGRELHVLRKASGRNRTTATLATERQARKNRLGAGSPRQPRKNWGTSKVITAFPGGGVVV